VTRADTAIGHVADDPAVAEGAAEVVASERDRAAFA
jgi:hypothetical protein